MAKPTARKTDEHEGICDHRAVCCPHNVFGIIEEGSPDVFANGLPVARLGDKVIHNCPHCGIGEVASASGTVFANGLGVARIGDKVVYPGGSGIIVAGSPNVNTGD